VLGWESLELSPPPRGEWWV